MTRNKLKKHLSARQEKRLVWRVASACVYNTVTNEKLKVPLSSRARTQTFVSADRNSSENKIDTTAAAWIKHEDFEGQ